MDFSKLFIFKNLDTNEINQITATFPTTQKFHKGDVIYSQETFQNALGFIVKGSAVAVSNNGSKVHLKNFEANMCFGAAALFGGKDSYVSTVTAKTDMEILFISEELLEQIFTQYPKTAINYISFLSDKVRFLNTKLCVISCTNAEDTILTYLSEVADAENYADIPKNMTVFAKMLGLSRATLYRALDTLEQNGNIFKENNKYKVIKNEKNY